MINNKKLNISKEILILADVFQNKPFQAARLIQQITYVFSFLDVYPYYEKGIFSDQVPQNLNLLYFQREVVKTSKVLCCILWRALLGAQLTESSGPLGEKLF